MIDRERVIKGLGCCIESYDKGFCPDECEYRGTYPRGTYPDCEQGLMREARELLKAQEPKPVIVKTNAYDNQNYYCQKCGSWFEYAYRKPNYCDLCGQAVKWDEHP